ncbi:hypothetical protein GWK47_009433 [Chionoecetes opilio]|uniref:Uncharacterized protein n=1 Tax=Chionoecetes opilio TaxID=41210 RepID=A0A8J4XZ52_CHIOP|nr:hypothetical protein GWK47_009433 [Chionoecetes opilio]
MGMVLYAPSIGLPHCPKTSRLCLHGQKGAISPSHPQSTFSSMGNSVACVLWEDFLKPLSYFRGLSDSSAIRVIKILWKGRVMRLRYILLLQRFPMLDHPHAGRRAGVLRVGEKTPFGDTNSKLLPTEKPPRFDIVSITYHAG